MNITTLEDLAHDLYQQIVVEANIEEEEKFFEAVFVDRMIDYLHEAQEMENGISCSYKGHGMKVNGYDFNSQQNSIDIIVAHYDGALPPPVPKATKSDIDRAFKRATTFLIKSMAGHYEKLEESSEVFDLSKLIHDSRKDIARARILLFTDCLTGNLPAKSEMINDIEVGYQIWDVERLYRFISSGMKKDPVIVDFISEFGSPLECIISGNNALYTTYLSIVPGKILSSLYDKWGTRILERNVRAFLQARGKVNQGIRDTIVSEPDMFLAYNNGITVTAEIVDLDKNSNGHMAIKRIKDFQIVNGGQTVASLWHTHRKNKAPLDNISLQMKLTVINDFQKIEEITPKISKYSNTQNKVNTADFYANDPFHINLEKISRTTWAPDPTGGGQQSIWFYERSRGSYDETRNRERTPAKIKVWDKIHPRKQKFDKLMLAKIENTWSLQPHIVSRGAQKNFADFSIDLKEHGDRDVDQDVFKDIISKLIIWKKTEKIISSQNIPGYRANIVTYTIALLLNLTGNRINLEKIWNNQEIGDPLTDAIEFLSNKVREHITSTSYNVTEWCKKEVCWNKLLTEKLALPSAISSELIDTSVQVYKTSGRKLSDKDEKLIEWSVSIGANIWKNISRWGSLTTLLETWERSISYSVGKSISRGKKPSIKQAYQAKKIYDKANRLGFKPD